MASIVLQYAGFGGLALAVVACGAAMVGLLVSICLRQGASVFAVCIAVFSASLVYPGYEASPNVYLAASPNTATMLFCVLFYVACLNRTRCLWLPLVMLAWANLHGGFVLGFFILGLFGGVYLLRRDWDRFRIYGLAAVGCFVATLVNPLGWHIYAGVAETLGHFVQPHTGEWKPYSYNMSMPGSLPGIVYILAFVALELRHGRGSAIPLETRIMSWMFLLLGLYQFRYLAFFFLFSSVAIAIHLDRFLPKPNAEVHRSLLVAGIVGAFMLPLAFWHVKPALALPEMLTEQDARYLNSHLSHARLLNHWNVGGLLIYRTQGTIPVFVDGRAATAYPDELLRDYLLLGREEVDEAAWDMVLAKYRIDAVLWVRTHEALRRFLVGKRGWTEAYTGLNQTVYVKP